MSRLSKLFRPTPEVKAVDEMPPITLAQAVASDNVNQYLRDMLVEANAQIAQLKFLLASAPMIDMFSPSDSDSKRRLSKTVSPFAYIHPKTLAPFTWGMPPKRVYVFPGSKTVWVPMSTMPEGRVIFSPIPVPGIDKLLVGSDDVGS